MRLILAKRGPRKNFKKYYKGGSLFNFSRKELNNRNDLRRLLKRAPLSRYSKKKINYRKGPHQFPEVNSVPKKIFLYFKNNRYYRLLLYCLITTFLFYFGGAFFFGKNVYDLMHSVLERFSDLICNVKYKGSLEVDKIPDILEKYPDTADTVNTTGTDKPAEVGPQNEGNWFYRNRGVLIKVTALALAVTAGTLAYFYFGGASPFKDDGYISEDYPGFPGPTDFKRVRRRMLKSRKLKKKWSDVRLKYWLWREKYVLARYGIPEDWYEIWNFLIPVYDEDLRPWKKRRTKK